MSSWKSYKLSEFIDINPKIILKTGGTYSFVEMKDLDEKNKFAKPSQKRELKGGTRFQEFDTLFARITPCLENGKICQVKGLEGHVGFGSTEFLVFRGLNGVSDTNFVFYLSRHPIVRKFAEQNLVGTSGRQRVSKEAFEKIELLLPPLDEQKAIAEILSSLDDKIELNNQINANLEALAQAIFKQWFIDFDFPDENGNPYKSSGGKMVESEFGEIPDGWQIKKLKEILNIKRGGSPRPIQDYIAPTGLPWVKISDATAINTPFIFHTKEFIKPEGLKKTVLLKKGSLILSNSATPGLPKFLELDACIHDGWLHFQDMTDVSYQFLYLLFVSIRKDLVGKGNGSIFINLKTDILKEYSISVPSPAAIRAFDKVVIPIFEQIKALAFEANRIADLRDLVLPKLLSGQIGVA